MVAKTCTSCQKIKKVKKWSSAGECSACTERKRLMNDAEARKRDAQRKLEWSRKKPKTTRVCVRCSAQKTLKQWFAGPTCGACHQAEYLANCPEQVEKARERSAIRRKRMSADELAKARVYGKQWREANAEYCRARKLAYMCTPEGRYTNMKRQAKERQLEMNIHFNDFARVVAAPCYYCGSELPPSGSGVDRIENAQGYVYLAPGVPNIIPACADCNYVRSNHFSVDEFLKVTKLLQRLRGKQQVWKS
jgi:hypothetical protein